MSKGERNRKKRMSKDKAHKIMLAEPDYVTFLRYLDWTKDNSPVAPYNYDKPCCVWCHNTEGKMGKALHGTDVMRWCLTHEGTVPLHEWDCTQLIRGYLLYYAVENPNPTLHLGGGDAAFDAAFLDNLGA